MAFSCRLFKGTEEQPAARCRPTPSASASASSAAAAAAAAAATAAAAAAPAAASSSPAGSAARAASVRTANASVVRTRRSTSGRRARRRRPRLRPRRSRYASRAPQCRPAQLHQHCAPAGSLRRPGAGGVGAARLSPREVYRRRLVLQGARRLQVLHQRLHAQVRVQNRGPPARLPGLRGQVPAARAQHHPERAPPAHRHHPRHHRCGRLRVHLHGHLRAGRPARLHPQPRPAARGPRQALFQAAGVGSGVPALAGHQPPRPQVRERAAGVQGVRQDRRLRLRALVPRRVRPAHPQRHLLRQRRLRRPGDPAGHAVQPQDVRRLVPGLHSVHHADGHDALRRLQREADAQDADGQEAHFPGPLRQHGQQPGAQANYAPAGARRDASRHHPAGEQKQLAAVGAFAAATSPAPRPRPRPRLRCRPPAPPSPLAHQLRNVCVDSPTSDSYTLFCMAYLFLYIYFYK